MRHRLMESVRAQALNEAKASDLMFWASSYNLFVHWSTNRSHPWDKLPKANSAACTLEIGKLRDSDNEVRMTPVPYMKLHMQRLTSCQYPPYGVLLDSLPFTMALALP